jgi:hypothetical protein
MKQQTRRGCCCGQVTLSLPLVHTLHVLPSFSIICFAYPSIFTYSAYDFPSIGLFLFETRMFFHRYISESTTHNKTIMSRKLETAYQTLFFIYLSALNKFTSTVRNFTLLSNVYTWNYKQFLIKGSWKFRFSKVYYACVNVLQIVHLQQN